MEYPKDAKKGIIEMALQKCGAFYLDKRSICGEHGVMRGRRMEGAWCLRSRYGTPAQPDPLQPFVSLFWCGWLYGDAPLN